MKLGARGIPGLIMAVILFTAEAVSGGTAGEIVQMIPAVVDMETNPREETKRKEAQETGPGRLYSLSAVLMDGDSGRVLYEKDGMAARPNASTTKVMTCILALENGAGDDYVQVSANAAAQPEVKLNLKEGEQYYLEDLLYSLMLKSHNDTAVAIAEHIGGSVENFAAMMNKKAEELGCTDTHFVTPNGLDSADSGGVHHTTARDLALIMRYAIRSSTFLKITQTRDYSFTDLSGKRRFSVHNANALLDMMDGVLSGKTGFTGNAGYCYVCAVKKDGKTFVAALLGCGWPNHKTYKWSDTKALLQYGEENFDYVPYYSEPSWERVEVQGGVNEKNGTGKDVFLEGRCEIPEADKKAEILLKKGEKTTCRVSLPKTVSAPVKKGQAIGMVSYYLGTEKIAAYPIVAEKQVEKHTYFRCVDRVFHDFFH